MKADVTACARAPRASLLVFATLVACSSTNAGGGGRDSHESASNKDGGALPVPSGRSTGGTGGSGGASSGPTASAGAASATRSAGGTSPDTRSSGGATSSTTSSGGAISEVGSGGAKPCLDTKVDPDNCGTCGTTCGIVKLASQQTPTAIAVDDSSVYWVNGGTTTDNGALMKLPISGGNPITLATAYDFGAIAVDASSVYTTSPSAGKVLKIPKGGGAPTELASNETGPTWIAVDAESVYWTTFSTDGCSNMGACMPDGAIKKVAKAGGTPKIIASHLEGPGSLAVDATNVYWTTPGLNYFGGSVYKAPIAGGAPTALASKQVGVREPIAVSSTNVYWMQVSQADGGGGNVVVTVPIQGGAITQLSETDGQSLVVKASDIYFVDQYAIKRMPLAGGAPVAITSRGGVQPRDLTVGATNVYWANQLPYDGSIMTITASTCTAGQCACSEGMTLCFGECVDLKTSPTNCGACGTACGAGPICMNGHCGV